jgi:hypothetical protein
MFLMRCVLAAFVSAGVPEVLSTEPSEPEAEAQADATEEGGMVEISARPVNLDMFDGITSQTNIVIIQFIGFTPAAVGPISAESKVRFVVNPFYEFGPACTPELHLQSFDSGQTSGMMLLSTDKAEPVGYGTSIRYEVKGSAQGSGRSESCRLANYLSTAALGLEIFDAESLFHVASTTVDLKGVVRRQPDGTVVEITRSIPMVSPVLPGQDEQHANQPAGLLHLRVACVGTAPAESVQRDSGIVQHGPCLSLQAPLPPRHERNKRLVRSLEPDAKPRTRKGDTAKLKRLRNLQRMKEHKDIYSGPVEWGIETGRLEQFQTISDSRDSAREVSIKATLEKNIERTLRVDFRSGCKPYFEVELANIKTRPMEFKLKFDSVAEHGSFSVLTDRDEIRSLKTYNELETPLLGEMAAVVNENGEWIVTVAPHCVAYCPCMWYPLEGEGGLPKARSTNFAEGEGITAALGHTRGRPEGSVPDREAVGCIAQVDPSFTTYSRAEVSALPQFDVGSLTIKAGSETWARVRIQLAVRPMVLDATFHMYGAKGQQVSVDIHVAPHMHRNFGPKWRSTGAGFSDSAVEATDLLAHRVNCSDPDTIAEICVKDQRPTVSIRHRFDDSSQATKTRFLCFYSDTYENAPSAIWQLTLHGMNSVYIPALAGQTNVSTLLLHGRTQKSWIFSWLHSLQLTPAVAPENQAAGTDRCIEVPAAETTGTLSEYHVAVRPPTSGGHCWRLQALVGDTAGDRRVAESWLVGSVVAAPEPTRVLETTARKRSAQRQTLKVEIRNPFPEVTPARPARRIHWV